MKFYKTIFLLLAVVVAFTGCKLKGEEPQSETIKYVKIETISNDQGQTKMVFNGKIKEKSLTSLSFRVGGPLAELNVKPGDYVTKGQVIAAIDKRDYEIQIQTTKAQFEQVEGEYNRYKKLVEMNKIPKNTFEKVESGYKMAKAGYENAQNQLRDTELRAPFSGYIHDKMTENYQTVGPGQPVVSIIDISQLEVVINVPENQLQQVKSDKESFLNVRNAGVDKLPVKLKSVSEKTLQDGLYEVKYIFKNNKELNIAPGMTAEITTLCEYESGNTAIASSAVFHEKNSNYVWIYNTSTKKVEKRKIEIGKVESQGKIQVLSGLKGGEQIVTAGVHYLVDGQKVNPIETPSETNVGGLL